MWYDVAVDFDWRRPIALKIRNLKVLTECGMLIAVALALSNVKIFQMPSGGSVSLGPLPLMLLAARHGVATGVISGALLGILALVNRPYIVHPVQFLLDYPFAFASLGLAGMMQWQNQLKATTATTAANFVRLHFHVVAGAVFFVADKDTVTQALLASYAYNISHLLPETVICAALAGYMARYHQTLCARQGN